MSSDRRILYFCALEKTFGNNLHVNQILPLINGNRNISALIINPIIDISRRGFKFPKKITGWQKTTFVYAPFPSFLFVPWLWIFPFIYMFCLTVLFFRLLFVDCDVIHCRNTMSAAIALPAAFVLSKKVICDVRGLYADEGVIIGRWNYASFSHKFFRKIECLVYKHSNVITAVSPELAKYVNQLIQKDTTNFVPAIVNAPNKYSSGDQNKYREKLGIPHDHFCLIYVGSLGAWHTEEMLITQIENYIATRRLEKEKVMLIILTSNSKPLKKKVAGLYKHHMVLSVPPRKVHQYLCAADAGLLPGRDCTNKAESNILETMISSKAQEYLAYGLEIVANPRIKFFQTDDIKTYHGRSRHSRVAQYRSYFSPETVIKQYQELYND